MEWETSDMQRITEKFLKELWQFLKEARAATYASGAEPILERRNPGFKLFVYSRGRWLYNDSFTGSRLSGGRETIWYKAVPVWYMVYGGGMTKAFRRDRRVAKKTFRFLKEALLLDSEQFQPRGAQHWGRKDWYYYCRQLDQQDQTAHGPWDITEFQGKEWIVNKNDTVTPRFIHRFHGGLIIR